MPDVDAESTKGTAEEAPLEQYEYVEEVVEYRDTRTARLLLAVILVLLALLASYLGYRVYRAQAPAGGAPKAAASKGLVWVRSIYGWGSAPDQQLLVPNTVTIADDGTIWTNSNNRQAVAFHPDGSFDRILKARPSKDASGSPEKETTGTAPTSVDAIYSLATDSDGNLYVLDNAQEAILRTTPEAGVQQAWSMPKVNKIGANDTRVAALTQGTLGVFDPDSGKPVFYFGSRGPGELQFDNPWGVHLDEKNYVYVADTMNRRVRKFDPTGTLLWDAGTVPDKSKPQSMNASTTIDTGIFELPTGVTTDANGRVVVVDAFKFQIIVLDGKSGKRVASYGDFGQLDGQFDKPAAIAYDAKRDWFVIADTDNNRLQIVRIPGSAKSGAAPTLRRAFDRPIWICCLPFLILLLAAIVVAAVQRRRRDEDAAGEGQGR